MMSDIVSLCQRGEAISCKEIGQHAMPFALHVSLKDYVVDAAITEYREANG